MLSKLFIIYIQPPYKAVLLINLEFLISNFVCYNFIAEPVQLLHLFFVKLVECNVNESVYISIILLQLNILFSIKLEVLINLQK